MQSNLTVLGSELKKQFIPLGENFTECGWFLDIIYEILEELDLEFPREGGYSDSEVNNILNTIYINRDLADSDLGKLVYSIL
jgi:hypothetical protein